MSTAPVFDIDTTASLKDLNPFLEHMRASCPIAYVPALDVILITKRDDVFTLERKIDVFSSDQPDGLTTKLMGHNMMRKDGAAHQTERKAIFSTLSPKQCKPFGRFNLRPTHKNTGRSRSKKNC